MDASLGEIFTGYAMKRGYLEEISVPVKKEKPKSDMKVMEEMMSDTRNLKVDFSRLSTVKPCLTPRQAALVINIVEDTIKRPDVYLKEGRYYEPMRKQVAKLKQVIESEDVNSIELMRQFQEFELFEQKQVLKGSKILIYLKDELAELKTSFRKRLCEVYLSEMRSLNYRISHIKVLQKTCTFDDATIKESVLTLSSIYSRIERGSKKFNYFKEFGEEYEEQFKLLEKGVRSFIEANTVFHRIHFEKIK